MMARKIEADAAPIGVWRRIAVPSAGPGFKTVALFSFIAAWTDLLIPITMPTRPDGGTLTADIIQMRPVSRSWGALMSRWGSPASSRKRSTESRDIVRGLDTHKDLHIAAVVDDQDRIMGTQSFATPARSRRKCSPGRAPSGLAMPFE
jgi:hypothetical protein